MMSNDETTLCIGSARKALNVFSGKMEKRLQEKDNEKGEEGWLVEGTTVKYLFGHMECRMKEIEAAMLDCDLKNIEKGCIDIANYAMMISDRIRGRKSNKL